MEFKVGDTVAVLDDVIKGKGIFLVMAFSLFEIR